MSSKRSSPAPAEPENGPSSSLSTLDASRENSHVQGKKLKTLAVRTFVNLPRFDEYLKKMNLLHTLRCPILIEGPMGCGKSTLIEEFHRRTSSELVAEPFVLNMGEQSDAKTLFGAFVTNPSRPGEFCWKAGIILEAMSSGRWLIIEDIDLASPEMVATIKGLLESETHYYVAQMGQNFSINKSFRIIATKRSDSIASSHSSSAFDRLGHDLWQYLSMNSLTQEELCQLLSGRFPQLSEPIRNVILRLFDLITEASSDISSNSLFKFAERIVSICKFQTEYIDSDSISEEVRRALLYEAVDCFASSWSNRDKRKELAIKMSILLSLPESHIDELYNTKPEISLNSDRTQLSIGRIDITCESQGMPRFRALDGTSNGIAFTTLSCQTLEKLAVAVKMNEPVLLVGETGTGKTTTVQQLAQMIQYQPNLRVLNMSQQSEASDLLGGFKPFSAQSLARPLLDEFLNLFEKAFSKSKNGEYLSAIQEAFAKQSWKRFIKLVKQAIDLISGKLSSLSNATQLSSVLLNRLKVSLERFEGQVNFAANNLLFSFVEGSLVEALTEGHWLLLDEINLASPETLNILAGLLRDTSASVILTERGDSTPIPRHPNFRLFACMNPATDVSKRDLPPAIRSRFTQIFVDETDVRREDLRQVIDHLIGPGRDGTLKERLTALYYRLKELVQSFELVDGNGRKPLLNLRTLTRPIKFARSCENLYGFDRALYEGWCLSFTTMLDGASAKATRDILREFLLPTASTIQPLRPFTSAISAYTRNKEHIIVEGHVLLTGPLHDASKAEASSVSFVLTPSVQKNVAMLARAVMARNYPILLEGPTSAGKTSVIEYLAIRTGHQFVRINNHEHTDIQEYLGTYVSDSDTGRLVFKEGILVQALRKGHWLVLDELNLAPSDILEALNRLLDDNRELFLPETGETVRPHPDFQLFATQNPAGAVYGGRKALSRAFRSRFLELQFNDLPLDEVEQILSSRCQIAPSFARRIAQVFRILQERRSQSGTNLFAGKHALITLRDCFRWAGRHSSSAVGSTFDLAQDGYFVLAERCRHPEEAVFIRETLEKVCKVKLPTEVEMYDISRICEQHGWNDDLAKLSTVPQLAHELGITWTKPIKRLFALVYLCIRFREPLLLVGETGCGKTTVCQLVAKIITRSLKIVNCHANTESGDFLGSFRPVRNEPDQQSDGAQSARLFQWVDGPLVEAMQKGEMFLMDEISLADDSVLERLNSVLEPSRYLLLAECSENDDARLVSASSDFAILATMNPGGDFGKKELSPALRNRFTEIWVPTIGDQEDLKLIIQSCLESIDNLDSEIIFKVTGFWYWWQDALIKSSSGASILSASKRTASSLRDLLSLLHFCTAPSVIKSIPKLEMRLLNGVTMVFTDRLGSENMTLRIKTINHFADELGLTLDERNQVLEAELFAVARSESDNFSIGPFSIPISKIHQSPQLQSFAFEAPTTRVSALRVLRALQLGKAVLLEGSPGVGKTTLIGALASATGNQLTRINLSEQTDLVDLFGSDLPVDGGVAGSFRWADGPFLQAMKRGDWILLDELNLASQSVLEGLNACLDHRGRIFIPELGREFACSPKTRIFAAQNPAGQGGGRKGLPKSFLNRFTIVWFDSLTSADYQAILSSSIELSGGILKPEDIAQMIKFNELLNANIDSFSANGRPWEFNLRDLSRWVGLVKNTRQNCYESPIQFIRALYASRFRCEDDVEKVAKIVESIYGIAATNRFFRKLPSYNLTKGISDEVVDFEFSGKKFSFDGSKKELLFLREQLVPVEASLMALEQGWLCILTGPAASGKTSLIKSLAKLCDKQLRQFFVSPDTDTLELLGSFEQVDFQRRWNLLLEEVQLYHQALTIANASDYSSLSSVQLESLINPCCESLKLRIHAFFEDCKTGNGSEGRFEWVDGPLVRALSLGTWLVLENVNLASSAVLDRLNSLFEPNGHLVLSEQGCSSASGVRIIRPAPGFRLFMTVDPRFGEISRAMRNRGMEIACYPRKETRIIDDLQILRNFSKGEDPRLVSVLLQLLPYNPSRRLLQRISQAAPLLPLASSEELISALFDTSKYKKQQLSVEPLNAEDEFWIAENGRDLPFLISTHSLYPSEKLQFGLLQRFVFSDNISIDSLALLSLFLLDWSSPESFSSRLNEVSKLNGIDLKESFNSSLELFVELVKSSFSTSESDLEILEDIKSVKDSKEMLTGFLIWLICNDRTRTLQSYDAVLKRFQKFSIPAFIEIWNRDWKAFGFRNEPNSGTYSRLMSFLCSESAIESPDSLIKEIYEAVETIFISNSTDVLSQVDNLSHVLTARTQTSTSNISKSKLFLSDPLALIFLNKVASNLVKKIQIRPSILPSMPRASFAQDWLSQVWSLSAKPLNFFSGYDGLGDLLETLNRSWSNRRVVEEKELMSAFEEVLKFVVRHGGKDKRQERIEIIRFFFDYDHSMSSCNAFSKSLIQTGLQVLRGTSEFLELDPVADYYQVNQRSCTTLINFYSSRDRHQRLLNAAYVGSKFLIESHNESIHIMEKELELIDDCILARPMESSTWTELKYILSSRISPLVSQIQSCENLSKIQTETIQNSLLHLRNELLSTKFILYRDMTCIFINAIDKLKVGLYFKQIESQSSTFNSSNLIPFDFASSAPIATSGNLVQDTVLLNVSRYRSEQLPGILSVLSRTLEHVHEAIKSEAAKSQKDDSLFVFKGSNNDDDALDAELASELFGDYEKRVEINHREEFDEEHQMEIDDQINLPDKRINYAELSADLVKVCEDITAIESDNLSEINETISRTFEFLSKTEYLNDFSDAQVYRMLIWTIAEKLSLRRQRSDLPGPKTLSRKSNNKKGHYDFYRDPCPEGRIQEALSILTTMNGRLEELLSDYPDHDVLQALQKQIQRFFACPASSTTMIEALLAMEKLYLRSQDWEKYAASSQTSLGQCVSDLLHIIVDWRRAELDNWRGLVDSVVFKMEYDAIIKNGEWISIARVALSHVEGESKESISTIMELIDAFMVAAPVGQFSKRLNILEFCTQLAEMNSNSDHRATANAFNAALAYYKITLAHRITEYVRVCREPVDRDLSAFLMTLYWKDVNYWSVRQTAEKSHKHLAKMIRKWKEAMQMPLSSLLNQLTIKAQLQMSSMDEKPNKKAELSKRPSDNNKKLSCQTTKPITSLGIKAMNRLAALDFSTLDASVIEGFGVTILDTLKELKESSETSIQHKQKAFVDLIRELKIIGIRINKNPSDDLLAAKSILCSFAQSTKLERPRDHKAEYYLVRTLEKWQKLASSVAHEDITFRQAEIIKNSMAFLIEMLICGRVRENRDNLANEVKNVGTILDIIKTRKALSGRFKSLSLDAFNNFKIELRRGLVLLAQLRAMFDNHRIHTVSTNWQIFIEQFSLVKSSLTEIYTLVDSVKTIKDCIWVFLNEASVERISLLIDSLVQNFSASFEESQLDCLSQISDLISPFKNLIYSINTSWSSFEQNCGQLAELSTLESEDFVKKILLSIQSCENEILLPSPDAIDEFSFYPDYLRKQSESSIKVIGLLESAIKPALLSVLRHSSCSVEMEEISIMAAEKYISLADRLVLDHFRHMGRLTLILSNVFLHLFQEGYCRPPPAEEEQKASENSKDGRLTEGTGIGEGEGEKNVSKEIEFEEQVMGTLDEKEDPQSKDEKDDKPENEDDKDDQLDMSQDFDGALEDLMDDLEGEEDKEKEDKAGDEDEEIPQDEMKDEDEDSKDGKNNEKNEEIQDLDPSWWDSDNEDDEEVEAPEDSENKQKLPDSKDQKQPEKSKDPKDDDKKHEENPLAAAEDENETDEAAENDQDESNEIANEDEDGAQDSHDDETMSIDEGSDAEKIQDDEVEASDENLDVTNDDVGMENVESETDNENEDSKESPDAEEKEVTSDEDMENMTEQKEISPEDAEPEAEDENENGDEDEDEDEKDNSEINERSNENTSGYEESLQQNEMNDSGEGSTSTQIEQSQQDQKSGSDAERVRTFDTQGQSSPQNDEQESSSPSPQPIAEQVEKWKRTIHRILNPEAKSKESQTASDNSQDKFSKEQQYEEASADDEKAMNVKAEAEEAAQINGEDDTSASQDKAMAVDDEDSATAGEDGQDENEANDLEEDKAEMKLVPHLSKSSESNEKPRADILDKDLEEHLRQLSLLPCWSEFEQNTSELAFDLCEQLRLVLAPTQATKLRGDYRTGKRLNLRKIIPYIASQYRRDKIWLRRTKPSQRNYRICLSIDNSKSMMETGSVGLAFEAIATISQALERLEAGELALIGFGEESRVLQQFSSGLAKVSVGDSLRSGGLLQFNEASTNVPLLLESVLDAFASAPAGNSSAPTWQLNIILSDGICQQHDQIRPLLARCHSARILNIFVLLDNRPAESSIFELSHVEYVELGVDPLTGQPKTGIKMTKYLETFPFEYYVVLRDVKMLPGVLAESLKQWFELIALQEGEH